MNGNQSNQPISMLTEIHCGAHFHAFNSGHLWIHMHHLIVLKISDQLLFLILDFLAQI